MAIPQTDGLQVRRRNSRGWADLSGEVLLDPARCSVGPAEYWFAHRGVGWPPGGVLGLSFHSQAGDAYVDFFNLDSRDRTATAEFACDSGVAATLPLLLDEAIHYLSQRTPVRLVTARTLAEMPLMTSQWRCGGVITDYCGMTGLPRDAYHWFVEPPTYVDRT